MKKKSKRLKRGKDMPGAVQVMTAFEHCSEEMTRMGNAFRNSPTEDNALNAIDAWQKLIKARDMLCAYEFDPMRGVSLAG